MYKIGLTLALAVAVHSAGAQGVRVSRGNIPRGHLPPPGMCRVWYDNLPPGRQPPATTCERAEREAWRSGGRVIYGERWNDRDDRWNDRDRRDRDRPRDRECSYRNGRRNDCDWRDERCRNDDRHRNDCNTRDDRCRDQDRNGRCDRDGRYSRGAIDALLGSVLKGRVGRLNSVRRWPDGWSRTEVTDSIPDGTR